MTTELPYRPNVCLLIYNCKKELFLGLRVDRKNYWQFPQGGVEESKGSIEDNVLAEASEELGVSKDLFKIICKLKSIYQYDFFKPREYQDFLCCGQKQTFWILQFLGSDKDINLSGYNPEFKDFRWCQIEKVLSTVHPEKREGYKKPIDEFIEKLDELPI
jgi:putative (di)nucleoside polyphosphate hydrolase